MGGVKDERDALGEADAELVLQEAVALFGPGGADLGQLAHLRVVVDIKVVGLKDAPVKVVVDDLVAPEIILCASAAGDYTGERGEQEQAAPEDMEESRTVHDLGSSSETKAGEEGCGRPPQ